MIVDDSHVVCVAIAPDETDAVLIVHADAVLAPPVAREGFEPIAREGRKVAELPSGVKLEQLPLRHARNGLQASAVPT